MGGDFEGHNDLRRKSNQKKRSRHRIVFDKVAEDNDFVIINEFNNIVNFKYKGIEYYFIEKTNMYRQQGFRELDKFTTFEIR